MEQYYYEYEQDSIYCYPDSFILKNKLNIRDPETLEEAERNITALRILELKQNPPKGKLTFKYFQKLHKQIFGDIYEWAGKVRNVNIAKGNMFCDCRFIEDMMEELFSELEKENYLQPCDTEEMADRLAYYLSEINALHPFREGNGRTKRLFIEILAERAGYEVDFSEVSAEEMVEASAKAFLRDYGKMNELMRRIVKKII